jgi:hypothetical protein
LLSGHGWWQSARFAGNRLFVATYDSDSAEYQTRFYDYGSSQWVNLDNLAEGSYTAVSLAAYGSTAYLAYKDSNNSNKLTVKKFTYGSSSDWETVGLAGISSGAVGSVSMALDPITHNPIVAYTDFSFSEKVSVQQFDGTSWSLVGSAGFNIVGVGGMVSLGIHPATKEPWLALEGSTIVAKSGPLEEGGGGGGGEGGGGGGTNLDGSKYFYNYAPVTLDINSTISIGCNTSVSMDAIVGTGKSDITLAGNKATNNVAMCNIKTSNSSGYKMEWNSSSTHEATGALKSTTNASDTIGGYTLSASSETWSIAPTASEWGAKLGASSEGYGTGDAGGDYSYASAGGWGTDDGYTGGKWMNVPTTSFQIMQKSTETDVDGEYQYLVFGAEIGADKLQPTGTYTQEVTVTATTL